jgi:hypothetical protein
MALHSQARQLSRFNRSSSKDRGARPNASTAVCHPRTLLKEIAEYRNKRHAKADWLFTTDDARIKLKHYPSI